MPHPPSTSPRVRAHPKVPRYQRTVEILRAYPQGLTIAELMPVLGVTEGTARSYVSAAQRDGLVAAMFSYGATRYEALPRDARRITTCPTCGQPITPQED